MNDVDVEMHCPSTTRTFDHTSTWKDVADMTVDEAIEILKHDAESDGTMWSARPHKARAAQIAIEALKQISDS